MGTLGAIAGAEAYLLILARNHPTHPTVALTLRAL
jgi:hypothetical protein